MATSIISLNTTGIRASVSPGHREPDLDGRKSSFANWWVPLFGWSNEPDYIDSNNRPHLQQKSGNGSDSLPASKPSRPRFAGCFTEEKAKQLRMMTKGSESFHDTMYHSAIASRLASDFKTRSDL